jgi:hypothetical protein
MILWVNLHGSFALGIGVLGLAWLGEEINTRSKRLTLRATWQHMAPLSYAGVATGLATLVHPLGVGIVPYVQTMLTNTSLQQWFVEWQPPTNAMSLTNTGFWFFLVLLLLAVLMASSQRRPSPTDLLWYCALAWLTISGERYAMWFALLLLPLLAEQLATIIRATAAVRIPAVMSVTYGGLLAALMIGVLPWFTPTRYLGAGSQTLFAQGDPYMLLDSSTPLLATEWLAHHPIEGRFWTDMTYTSYTIWRLPDKQVFTDLRVELFPEPIWRDYFAIARGDMYSLAILDQWQITHVMLDSRWQADLDTLLMETPGWCEYYRDQRSAIIARCP